MTTLHLFEGYGIELEYMMVRKDTLAVLPISDRVLRRLQPAEEGTWPAEVALGEVAWSNELVMHVIELKSNGPSKDLTRMQQQFQNAVTDMNRLLDAEGAMLLPTAMHPFFVPEQETKLWPHDNRDIYEAYNRVFGCKGHGWSNLQSVHINLPFAGDEEFGRLHAAIRLVLPILPALAASSPLVEGRATGILDNRLQFYSQNQKAVPSIAGHLIPEPVFSKQAYEEQILGRCYKDIAPFDPKGLLQEEWLNSRGAIARFDRNAIEIRLLDIQESVAEDFRIIRGVVGLVQALVEERWVPFEVQKELGEERLAEVLRGCIRDGERFLVQDARYLEILGIKGKAVSAGKVWRDLGVTQKQGSLATRILSALGDAPTRPRIEGVYRDLAGCLARGERF